MSQLYKSKRITIIHCFVLFAFSFPFIACVRKPSESSRLKRLKIFREDQKPVAYYFRDAEKIARTASWEKWHGNFNHLMGIEGKVLREEVIVNNDQVIRYFIRFKELHPEQLVLIHFNGRARDPIYESNPFFAGHWIYYNGATIQNNLLAEKGVVEIKVSDASLFKTNTGLNKAKNEDVGICELDADGKPNWHNSEQVKLLDVDIGSNTIMLERGCYGTVPRAFRANRAYAAAHVTEGSWGKGSNLMWYYNFSPLCPRDKEGKQAADILAGQLASWFHKDGRLEKFDGVEFDVLHHVPRSNAGARGLDVNADGIADNGIFNGVQTYGIGVVNFLKKLRGMLGDDRLIMADNDRWFHQRAVGILNGIESETFPTGSDDKFEDWAGGVNRLMFWSANSREPVSNYIARPDSKRLADIRLVLAAAALCDAGISMTRSTYFHEPEGEVFIWDELIKGDEKVPGWLGKAIKPTQRLAVDSSNLIIDESDLKSKIKSLSCSFKIRNGTIELHKRSSSEAFMQFQLSELECEGQDLFVTLTVSAEPMANYPKEGARLMFSEISGGEKALLEERVISNMALVNEKPFKA
ncbi:hypothetical protein [Gaoshiqia sediminis]|uniref:Uncharacterized protein n=1 Tax=Gaoshiqia sediminis TaxID=2986998 RepID=A0AA42C8P8_9BACT|nr:hypothetical protein [Gaoshiqia sediminis]MCW0484969.1 hypothetical protein [Gaoshiqia sediminis]